VIQLNTTNKDLSQRIDSHNSTLVETQETIEKTRPLSVPAHVGCPNIGRRERFLARVNDILDKRWFTNDGQYVQELEDRLSEYLGVKHCIAMCNGTIALEITIRALGLTGEVIVPSFTFVATAHALQWQEITPVFCDITPEDHTIDPAQLERLITPRTSGIIGVHTWGRPCNIEALKGISARHGLKIIFDAAHAFGCTHGGVMIGNFGQAEVFSFHATKFFNTFEGGAVATNDGELAYKIRLMKNFGFTGLDSVEHIGTNGKMNEICAAMGLTGLDSLEQFIAVNRQNYLQYMELLTPIPGLRILEYDESEKNNYQYITLEINDNAALNRDELQQALWSNNVLARRYFYPGCHRMEPYRSYFPHAGLLLPRTEELCDRVLVLPTGSAVTPEQIELICAIISDALESANAV
jgi:dTDP-4-amino-4,6-dideoxygalactose transaminase